MQETATRPSVARALSRVPASVGSVVDTLTAGGFEAYLVGGCVRDLLRGARVRDFDVATSASAEAVLQRFPRAIPIGLRHGTVMIPTPGGPVDVTSFRAGPRLEDDLAHRDFTVNALAADLRGARLIDPHGGVADLEAHLLRAVGSAAARLAEDPLRALRGIRLAVTHGFALEPRTESAMRGVCEALSRVPRERVRHELERILLASEAARGVELLRRCGFEAALAPGARSDAPRVIERLPAELPLRLAAWLRGTNADAILARLRFPRRTVAHVGLLVRLHPVDQGLETTGRAGAHRLVKRAGLENLDSLIALREAEIQAGGADPAQLRGALERLDGLRASLDQVRSSRALALHRRDLALDGAAVMRILGCGPGPRVGHALGHLTDRVFEDPGRNTPEGLRELLLDWAAGSGAAGGAAARDPGS